MKKEPSRNRINKGLKEAQEQLSKFVGYYFDETKLRQFAVVLVRAMHKNTWGFKQEKVPANF